MLFHRRGLSLGYALLFLGYLVTRFVPQLLDGVVLHPLILMRRNYLFDVGVVEANVRSFEVVLHNQQPLFRSLLIWFAVLIVAWCILDIFTGQLYRDYRSVQLSRYLKRSDSELSREEQRANRWISRSRFIRWNGRTMLIIPCFGNSTVEQIVKKRCDSTLMQWLADNFNSHRWQPLIVKHSGFITFFVVQSKK